MDNKDIAPWELLQKKMTWEQLNFIHNKKILDYGSGNGMTADHFRERKVDNVWIDDFNKFSEQQWSDFEYKLSDGECLREVQMRNIDALKHVLREYRDKNIVIGSHGTSLSTIINNFKPTFGYQDFQRVRTIMPWIVKLTFQGDELIQMDEINVYGRSNNRR